MRNRTRCLLLGHQIGAVAGKFARIFSGPVVRRDLGVYRVSVCGRKIDRRPNVAWVQVELFGQRGNTILRTSAGMTQRGNHFPDVGSHREPRSPPGGAVAIYDAGVMQRVQSFRNQALQ